MRLRSLLSLAVVVLFILSCSNPSENNKTYTLTTTVSPTEGGSISPSSGTFTEGEQISLTATPSQGWSFVRWEVDIASTANPLNLTMNKDYTVVGVFQKNNYELNVTVVGEGTVQEQIVTGREYPYQTSVQLTAVPDEGWVFTGWSGDLQGTENPTVISITSEKNVTATFERQNFELTVNVEGEGEVIEEVITSRSLPYQTTIRLTAVPEEGWRFDGWTGASESDESVVELTITQDTEITATFVRREYELSIDIQGNGTVDEEVVTARSYPFQTIVRLTAQPATGWKFVRWEDAVESTENPVEVTVNQETNVVAIFERESYELTVTVQGEGEVLEEVVPARSYEFESFVKLTAVPSAGWGFSHWQGDLTGEENPTTIQLTTNKAIQAVFRIQVATLSATTVSEITAISATASGNVSAAEGLQVIDKGICYGTTNTGANHTCISAGANQGDITLQLSNLTANATYYARIYAQTPFGTTYGAFANFRTMNGRPTFSTVSISNIQAYSANFSVNVVTDGGAPVTSKGVCYSSTVNPTTADTCIEFEAGTGSMSGTFENLQIGTTYYVRGYATNIVDTRYSTGASFKTLIATAGAGVTDIDGNSYTTSIIGSQEWMAENLRTATFRDGTPISNIRNDSNWFETTLPAWVNYDNNPDYDETYGKLYNWNAMSSNRMICPAGWSVPTEEDWNTLVTYLGERNTSGGKLKETGTTYWQSPNTGATNESGFNARPNGVRFGGGAFGNIRTSGHYWSSSMQSSDKPITFYMVNFATYVANGDDVKQTGLAIRCVRD